MVFKSVQSKHVGFFYFQISAPTPYWENAVPLVELECRRSHHLIQLVQKLDNSLVRKIPVLVSAE